MATERPTSGDNRDERGAARATNLERRDRRIGTVLVRDNPHYDTVELHFKSKPPEHVLTLPRSHGFRWIRIAGCWSRRGRTATTESKLELVAQAIGSPIEPVFKDGGA